MKTKTNQCYVYLQWINQFTIKSEKKNKVKHNYNLQGVMGIRFVITKKKKHLLLSNRHTHLDTKDEDEQQKISNTEKTKYSQGRNKALWKSIDYTFLLYPQQDNAKLHSVCNRKVYLVDCYANKILQYIS